MKKTNDTTTELKTYNGDLVVDYVKLSFKGCHDKVVEIEVKDRSINEINEIVLGLI